MTLLRRAMTTNGVVHSAFAIGGHDWKPRPTFRLLFSGSGSLQRCVSFTGFVRRSIVWSSCSVHPAAFSQYIAMTSTSSGATTVTFFAFADTPDPEKTGAAMGTGVH